MTSARRTQADRSAATRHALISAGRTLFAEHGFAGVGTEAVVREASVSRGALYHQFGDKTELFAAVLSEVEGELTRELAASVTPEGDFAELLLHTFTAWLGACRTPEVQRIVLIDGPSVLGWARWREICQHNVLGLIEQVLSGGMAAGLVAPTAARPLAHLLLAMADEAALYVGTAADPEAAQEEMATAIRPMIEALTLRP